MMRRRMRKESKRIRGSLLAKPVRWKTITRQMNLVREISPRTRMLKTMRMKMKRMGNSPALLPELLESNACSPS